MVATEDQNSVVVSYVLFQILISKEVCNWDWRALKGFINKM